MPHVKLATDTGINEFDFAAAQPRRVSLGNRLTV